MTQLHWLDNAVHNHGGTQARSQAQEKHLAALVAAQSLHGRVIDNLDLAAEGSSIVEPDPTRTEMMRFCYRPTMQDGPWIADRHGVVLPVPGRLLDPMDHLLGRHRRPRRELATF